ncbi:hypothetical protein EMIHUDRAFT_249682 [Emiliania huxleyi CCMP1516]|uniref:Peptidase C1A papain C-terminal domain-containing protein n=2 Tax=Emiliania huxleyi TaxID=2903 RepID=A0A0D3I640_EMIH1|nr:hypothetical protein EMIHUDRAFT_249682 [Emiliania huxleyi CCMP1516]EOD06725.1 hypothetical protein EMIHUDRAFT_249682 [Emiliania huxleyi CCMP1516]|eukprot:XP_005759154.1 hypothetical protein EMIHUDRAFT_249682 [Emiliania huxleyi CCMP1516]
MLGLGASASVETASNATPTRETLFATAILGGTSNVAARSPTGFDAPAFAAALQVFVDNADFDLSTETASIDWRTKGKVTAVKKQFRETCWAVAATEQVESLAAIKYGRLTNLSTHQAWSCALASSTPTSALPNLPFVPPWFFPCFEESSSCQAVGSELPGSHPAVAWAWMRHLGGLVSEETNREPPENSNTGCATPEPGTTLDNILKLPYTCTSAQDCVLEDTNCEFKEPNHNVQLVGYDDSAVGGPVWIVRNSWGAGRLHNGYFYVRFNSPKCGVASLTMNTKVE